MHAHPGRFHQLDMGFDSYTGCFAQEFDLSRRFYDTQVPYQSGTVTHFHLRKSLFEQLDELKLAGQATIPFVVCHVIPQDYVFFDGALSYQFFGFK
jgi:hypothetical protein